MADTPIQHSDLFDFEGYAAAIKDIEKASLNFGKSVDLMITTLSARWDTLSSSLKDVKTEVASTKNMDGLSVLAKKIDELISRMDGLKAGMKGGKTAVDATGTSVDSLKKRASELEKEYSSLTEEQRKNKAILDPLLTKYKDVNTTLTNSKKVLTEAKKSVDLVTGSYNEMSTKLTDMKNQLKAMPDAFDQTTGKINKNNQAAVTLINKIGSTDKALKQMDQGMGVYTRNVGNYASAFEAIPGPIGDAASGVEGFGKSLMGLLANPIVAIVAGIVAAFTLLIKAFKSTDEGATEFDARLEQIKSVVSVVMSRIADLASGIFSLLKGDFKAGFDKIKNSFSGISDQMKAATKSAYDYIYALDALGDAEISYISQKAKGENEIAKLEAKSADKTLQLKARRDALKEALKLNEDEVKKARDFAKQRYGIEIEHVAKTYGTQYGITTEYAKKFIEADDEKAAAMMANDKNLAEFRNKINDDGQKKLEEYYAAYINLDTEYFESNKRNISKLSGFEEEIRKERLAFIKQTETIKLGMLDDGRQKEISQAKLALTSELADITSNTVEANNLRTALKEQFKKTEEDINKKYDLQAQANALKAQEDEINLRLALVSEGSAEEFKLKAELINLEEKLEKNSVEASGAVGEERLAKIKEIDSKILLSKINLEKEKKKAETENANGKLTNQDLIETAHNNKIIADTKSTFKEIQKAIRDNEAIKQAALLNEQAQNEQFYKDGIISEREYLAKKAELNAKYLDSVTENEAKIAAAKKTFKEQELELVLNSASAANTIYQDQVSARIDQLNTEKDAAIKAAGDNAAAKAQIEVEFNRKIAKEKRKAAIADKAAKIFEIVITTAVAAMNSFKALAGIPIVGPGLGAAAATMTAALGAVQLAVVAAKPIPQFRHGTRNAPEGMAVVNDQSGPVFREMILRNNKAFIPTQRNTVMMLKKGDKVFPAYDTQHILNSFQHHKDLNRIIQMDDVNEKLSVKLSTGRNMEIQNNISTAMKGIVDEKFIVDGISQAIQDMPQAIHNWDDSGYKESIRKGNTTVNYINKKNSLG